MTASTANTVLYTHDVSLKKVVMEDNVDMVVNNVHMVTWDKKYDCWEKNINPQSSSTKRRRKKGYFRKSRFLVFIMPKYD